MTRSYIFGKNTGGQIDHHSIFRVKEYLLLENRCSDLLTFKNFNIKKKLRLNQTSLRILAGKNINTSNQLFLRGSKTDKNFPKNKVVTGKTPLFVISQFCSRTFYLP